jgi:hypothetical protein
MNQNALWVKFEQYRFVVGMEWRLLNSGQKLTRTTLSAMQRQGMYWYASSGLQDFIGVCTTIPQSKQPMYSAALHLATEWSNGGVELFAFGMGNQQVAVIGLHERRPVPGFDFIGTLTEAESLIQEFEAIHQDQPIRHVGDLGILANEEQLNAHTVFDQPNNDSKLKRLPSLKALIGLAATLVLLFGAGGGFYYWQLHERENMLTELAVPPPPKDPNPGYNSQVVQTIQKIRPQGQSLYVQWLRIAQVMPVLNQGWVLSQFDCKGNNCVAGWRRFYGSVDDFYAQLPPGTQSTQHLPPDKDVLKHRLETVHEAQVEPSEKSFNSLSELPAHTVGFRNISAWLQDLSLIGAVNVNAEKAQVWTNNLDAGVIKQPLYKGTWSAEIPLGMATRLQIPAFATVTQLQSSLGNTYQLTGDFYVHPD